MNSFDKSYKIRRLNSSSLNRSNQPFTELFRYDGVGSLESCVLAFNNDDIEINIEVDNVSIGIVDLEFLQDFSGNIEFKGKGVLGVDVGDDVFFFNPSYPIKFKESVAISARSNDNNTGRRFDRGVVTLEERV